MSEMLGFEGGLGRTKFQLHLFIEKIHLGSNVTQDSPAFTAACLRTRPIRIEPSAGI